MTEREKMLAGEPFLASDPEIVADLARAERLTGRHNRAPAAERRAILEELLGALGEDVILRPPFRCDLGYRTRIGARTFANFGLVVLDTAPVTIGADVQLGPNVQLLTPTHPIDAVERRAGIEAGEPIVIGDDVWLGGGVIVLPGVTVGAGTVVGAGAVVVRDLPAGVVAVGNPARVVREV